MIENGHVFSTSQNCTLIWQRPGRPEQNFFHGGQRVVQLMKAWALAVKTDLCYRFAVGHSLPLKLRQH